MTSTREAVSHGNGANPLCDKLQRQFRGRGMDAVRPHAPSTAAMVARVQRGLDPYENAPNPLSERRQAPAPRPAAQQRGAAVKTAVAQKTAPVTKTSTQVRTRSEADARRATAAVRSRSAAVAAKRVNERSQADVEVLPRAPFPMAAVSLLSIFTVMMLVILFSFAQNYELTSEISALSAEAEALAEKERDLSITLEERSDIRVIEDIAVNEIGMVKNHLVESRFVSVSGGDRVEIAESETAQTPEKSGGIFSTMLSAIGENLARLREYIG